MPRAARGRSNFFVLQNNEGFLFYSVFKKMVINEMSNFSANYCNFLSAGCTPAQLKTHTHTRIAGYSDSAANFFNFKQQMLQKKK